MGSFTNSLKTIILLGLLTGVLLLVGSFFGSQGLTIAIIFVLGMNFVSYFFSDKIVLAIYKAKPVPKSHWLYGLVKDVAQRAKLPTPKVYIAPTLSPNAFATGRNPNHAAVACTQGILELLTHEELKGVIAHELSHVKNRDTLITTIAATIAGVISYIAQMAQWGLIFGTGTSEKQGQNIFSLILMIIITPLVAMLIQLAISRSREYQADASGASLLQTGAPLASALRKLETSVKQKPLRSTPVTNATSSLFIVNPFTMKGLASLFSTHPSTDDRIQRLNAMKF